MAFVDPTTIGHPERALDSRTSARRSRGAPPQRSIWARSTGRGRVSAQRLWRTAHSEAWLNTWWQPRDSGFHDHDGSAGGVYIVEGSATTEGLPIGGTRRAREVTCGEVFSFAGDTIHRVDHHRGAVTVHVYSPPLRSIGCYEIVDGELRRTRARPDEPSPPSPVLSALLG